MSFKKNIILTYNFEVKVNLCEQCLLFQISIQLLKSGFVGNVKWQEEPRLDAVSQMLKGYKFIIYVSYLL